MFLTIIFSLYVTENFALPQKFQYGLITTASMYQWIRFVYNADALEQKSDVVCFAFPSLLPIIGGIFLWSLLIKDVIMTNLEHVFPSLVSVKLCCTFNWKAWRWIPHI